MTKPGIGCLVLEERNQQSRLASFSGNAGGNILLPGLRKRKSASLSGIKNMVSSKRRRHDPDSGFCQTNRRKC